MLKEITGFNNVSFQSNSARIEYSGLLCIRQYHIENYKKDNIIEKIIKNILKH